VPDAYTKVLHAIDRIISWVVIASMAVLTFVVVLQVFYRYVLNDSLLWGWDIPRLCFIWVVLLSIPLGIRYNAHVGVDLVFARLSRPVQKQVRRLNAVFMMLLCSIAAYYGVQLGLQTADQMMPRIRLSVALFYAGLLVSQVHCVLHILPILVTGETGSEHLSET
jgi:TRAP-type C4-dicarboxylate transport system permease small subunit